MRFRRRRGSVGRRRPVRRGRRRMSVMRQKIGYRM